MRLRMTAGLVLLLVAACASPAEQGAPPVQEPPAADPLSLEVVRTLVGQAIYVPAYSHIFYQNERKSINLTVVLSIRNTDPARPLRITRVAYYDSEGRLVRTYDDRVGRLGPMASTYVVVGEDDVTGGVGANFIVQWAADEPVTAPVVEAVMLTTRGSQGISFVRPGHVLQARRP